jgi:hypothetical protein
MSAAREPSRKKTTQQSNSSTSAASESLALAAGVELEDRDASQQKIKPRNPNFKEWEDLTLGRSYANDSCDPF